MQNKKITFFAGNDFANVLTEYSYAINKYLDGYESKIICKGKHKNKYEKQHDYDVKSNFNLKEATQWVKESEYIIFGEETSGGNFPTLLYFHNIFKIKFMKEKKVCVWHPGTHYRESYLQFNSNRSNNNFFKRLYAVDLYRLSPKSEKDKILLPYKFYDINKDELLKNFKNKIYNKPYIILHAPSNPHKKGTDFITQQIRKLKLNNSQFKYKVLHNKPNNVIINNKKESLFYVDQFNNRGGFGVASIESLLNSNFTFSRIDKSMVGLNKFYNERSFPVINLGVSEKSLQNELKKLFLLSEDELFEYSKTYVEDILHFYSPKKIIEDFKKNILDG